MNLAPCFHGDMKAAHPSSTSARGVLQEAALPERLARIDLNLLVAFDALAREQNVTRAAARVGVTQSAMSHALRRLRGLLDDPLLVRGKSGMVLTARAEALVLPLRSGLVSVDRALARAEQFDPRTARRKFRLATPDLFDLLAIPPLLEAIREQAPGVDLVVAPLDARLSDALETGEVDLCVAPRVDDFPGGAPELDGAGLVRRVLFRDSFSCFCRADHPALGEKRARRGGKPGAPEPLSVEVYAALSHVLVSPRGEGPGLVDELLAKQGLSRRVALRIPHFFSALAIVEKSDLILTAPTSLGLLLPSRSKVVALPAPLRLPSHAIALLWHERFSNEPGHAWLRDVMVDVTQRFAR
jgi:DNA-binding transcriptional LysR family regulator